MNNLTSDQEQRGHVRVTASTTENETVEMNGDIQIFGEELYLDVEGEIREFSVSSFNPYAEKFLGWGTRSGQLTTKIHVHIEKQRLKSKSKISISDLCVVRAGTDDLVDRKLGLPLGLIVDLIKNIKGEIHLKVQVDGPLNKPEFSIRDAIWKSLRNAIVSIATAPLQLIGSLVKRGSKIQKIDIHPIDFKAGTKTMKDGMEEHITNLQKFLKKPPYIRLKIHPVLSADDLHMLRIREVTSRIVDLEARKDSLTGVRAAQTIYKKRFPDKTAPEQEAALLEELVAVEPVPEEQAAALTSQRAKMFIDLMTESPKISSQRFDIDTYKENLQEAEFGGLEFSITR